MTTIIPFRSATLPPGELAALLEGVAAALPAGEARRPDGSHRRQDADQRRGPRADEQGQRGRVEHRRAFALHQARIAARSAAARRPDERPLTLVIVVETAQTTVRVALDPANPTAAVVAASLPARSDVIAVRLEV